MSSEGKLLPPAKLQPDWLIQMVVVLVLVVALKVVLMMVVGSRTSRFWCYSVGCRNSMDVQDIAGKSSHFE